MIYWFEWNGVKCGTKGIKLQDMPEIVRPEERVTHVTVPGRAGDLTQNEGTDIYESYIRTIQMIIDSAADVSAAEKWLRGNGYVTFSCQPELKQKARVINAVTFKKHSRNSSWWEGEVQFYCQPLKEMANETAIEVTASGTQITNPGDTESRPLITITGSGDVTVRIGEKNISITGAESGWKIDSDLEWVTNSSGTPQMGVYTGKFPTIPAGNSIVQFTGDITKLTIQGRWRYL